MSDRKTKRQKVIQGTFRKDRERTEKPAVTPEIKPRTPPSYLNRYAKAFWRVTAADLVASGVISVVDWAAFELCCDSYGVFREMKEAIRQMGGLGKYLEGRNSQTSPELAAMNKAMDSFLKFSKVLGLNPVSRQRLSLAPDEAEETDPIQAMWKEHNDEK